jgi:hypothetical protein
VEEIVEMNLIGVSLFVWVVVVVVLFVIASFESCSPDSLEDKLAFTQGDWSTDDLEFSVSLVWLLLAYVASSF